MSNIEDRTVLNIQAYRWWRIIQVKYRNININSDGDDRNYNNNESNNNENDNNNMNDDNQIPTFWIITNMK